MNRQSLNKALLENKLRVTKQTKVYFSEQSIMTYFYIAAKP